MHESSVVTEAAVGLLCLFLDGERPLFDQQCNTHDDDVRKLGFETGWTHWVTTAQVQSKKPTTKKNDC